MVRLDDRLSLAAFFCVGAVAACGSTPSVTLPPAEFGGVGNGGAATGTLITDGGVGPGQGDAVDAMALAFDPPSITLTLGDAGAVKTASYALKATLKDASIVEVTAESLEFDRPDLASFEIGPPALLTATGEMAGRGKLHAVYGGLEATADFVVNLVERNVDGAVPKAALTALEEANLPTDPALDSLLYPYDQTVFALGLTSPLLMWTAPNAAGDVYRVHLEQTGYNYDYYTTVKAPAQVRVPQDAWDRVTASNTGDALTLSVSRWDKGKAEAYSSVTESFTIASESLRGAIYYWTASQSDPNDDKTRVGNITRIYPGAGAKPETLNEGRCMGCHSVSADGSTLVATVEDLATAPSVAPYSNWSKTRAWAAFDLPENPGEPAKLAKQTDMYGANSALTPDGKYVVFGGHSETPVPGSKYISLAKTKTGEVVADSGLDDLLLASADLGVMMPAFSPDGTKLALVEASGDRRDNVLPTSLRIIYVDFDQKQAKFDAAHVHEVVKASSLPAGNDQLGYPSFSPDGKYISYHSGKYSTGCNALGCVDATPDSGELWVSATNGAGAPIRMAKLDDPPLAADHDTQREPTFCPVNRGGYSWVVFTSMRDWGNALTGPAINGKRRLWVAAVDQKLGKVDPSHPAFYVEGQNDETPNMRGFWALAKCIETPKPPEMGPACTAGFECCSGFCVDGQCVDKTSQSCAGVGNACRQAADCCNGKLTDCLDGVCSVVVIPK